MAFNRENPTHLATLKTEVNADPTGMDYAAAQGETKVILAKLNDPDLNVGNDTINRPTEELDIPDIAAVIDETEYASLSEFDKIWVQMLINQPADVMLKPFQSKFVEVFPNGSATLTAVLALRQKDASRAEVLFGVNTEISKQDWFAARDS